MYAGIRTGESRGYGYLLSSERFGAPTTYTREGLQSFSRHSTPGRSSSDHTPDPAGVQTVSGIHSSADGKPYAYSYFRILSDLWGSTALNKVAPASRRLSGWRPPTIGSAGGPASLSITCHTRSSPLPRPSSQTSRARVWSRHARD